MSAIRDCYAGDNLHVVIKDPNARASLYVPEADLPIWGGGDEHQSILEELQVQDGVRVADEYPDWTEPVRYPQPGLVLDSAGGELEASGGELDLVDRLQVSFVDHQAGLLPHAP